MSVMELVCVSVVISLQNYHRVANGRKMCCMDHVVDASRTVKQISTLPLI